MKTSVIRYRVADFLREHQPFDLFSLDDLLSFSSTGRIAFHEDDIYLFRKGEPRDPVILVIQQGRVEIIDETAAGHHLQDVLGPGDILGIGLADTAYPHTARTATEAILYSFDLSSFESLASKYPEASRFLTAHLSATARHTKALHAPANKERLLTEKEKAVWLNQSTQLNEANSQRLITCHSELPAREVAKLLVQSGGRPVAVTSSNGHPLGLITDEGLVSQLAADKVSSETSAQFLMSRDFKTAPRGLSTANYWLKMMRDRCQALAITNTGWPESQLQQVITDIDLEINCGRNPALLLREILAAETVADLTYLYQRANTFLVEGLVGPSVIEWFSQMFAEINAALIERLIHIAEAEMMRAGRVRPELRSEWLLFGRAGRKESLSRMALEPGLIYDDPPKDLAEETKAYYSTLFSKVSAKMKACGLQLRANETDTNSNSLCKPLSEWKSFYADLIRDPIINAIYTAREYFDIQNVYGDQELVQELKNSILAELEREEAFIPVLANDTLSNLPPLTFYQDSIIESDGTLTQTLDVEQTALTPIVDAARVLALAGRDITTSNTVQRLTRSASSAHQHASILNDAIEAWRILAYHHAAAVISSDNSSTVIQPKRLSRFEQRLLKSAFDSTRRFIELISTTYN